MNKGGFVSNKQLDRLMNSSKYMEPKPATMVCDEKIFPMSYFADWKISINKFNPNNIEKVIFNPPATIVIFKDGTKEIVKCSEGDEFIPEIGFAQAMMNVMFGSRSAYSKFIDKYNKHLNLIDKKSKSKDENIFTKDDMKDFLKGRFVVNCKTEKLASELLKTLNYRHGVVWKDDSDLDHTEWSRYEEKTCYHIENGNELLYCSDEFWKGEGYTIKEFKGW